jgi:hypothetical protein
MMRVIMQKGLLQNRCFRQQAVRISCEPHHYIAELPDFATADSSYFLP